MRTITKETPLSYSRLARFKKCELLFDVEPRAKDDTEALRLGRAAHALILEGRAAYQTQYTVDGPVNLKTGKPFGLDTLCVRNFESKNNITVISREMHDQVEAMAKSIKAHGLAGKLFDGGRFEAHIFANYCGVPCHGWVDFVSQQGPLVDLKTCDDIDDFENAIRRHDYTYQMAFYRALLAVNRGCKPWDMEVFLVAVEKNPPFRTGVWHIGQGVLGIAQQENEAVVERLKRCISTNKWSTGYEEVRSFDWM